MATLGSWPASLVPTSFRLVLQTTQRVNASPFGGSEQAVDLLNDRWMAYITLAQAYPEDARAIEAFVASFRGQVNTVDLWHLASPTPLGTITGSPTISGAHAQGADELNIATTTGYTVKAGDLLGVNGLLLMMQADATAAAGVLEVPIVNRLRTALTNGMAVTHTQPKAPFRLLSHSGVGYSGEFSEVVTMTLGEAI